MPNQPANGGRKVPDAADLFVKATESVVDGWERASRREPLARHRGPERIRSAVKRKGARNYVLLVIMSMAVSVALTRLFLELAGYPQIATSELHIAHVLWGGLLVFVAVLMTLTLCNRWVYSVAAILAGLGMGLFVDEVGKFITQSNNYFYAPAASIIYVLFLLTVWLYMRVRRPSAQEPRAVMYRVLEGLGEVLDRDLDPDERAELESRLAFVEEEAEDGDLGRLAGTLRAFVASDEIQTVPPPETWSVRLRRWATSFEERCVPCGLLRAVLVALLVLLALLALGNAARYVVDGLDPAQWGALANRILRHEVVASEGGTPVLTAWITMEGIVGVLLLAGVSLLVVGRGYGAARLSCGTLLFYLTVVDVLAFYYMQFSTILLAGFQFLALCGLRYYQRREFPPAPVP
jgi:hypothetical protein